MNSLSARKIVGAQSRLGASRARESSSVAERHTGGTETDPRDKDTRFANVVLPHLDDAYNLAHWLAGNQADAEDIVQDACINAMGGIGAFANFNARAWVLTIVRNTAYTWLAKNRKAALVFVEDLAVVESIHPSPFDVDINTPKADGARLHNPSRLFRYTTVKRLCCAIFKDWTIARSRR